MTTASAGTLASDGLARLRERVRGAARTTPGRLRLFSIAVVVLIVLAAFVAAVGISSRRASIDRTAERLEPLVVASQNAHASLVQADAAAAAAFLSGGAEDAAQSKTYTAALTAASRELQAAAESAAGDKTAQGSVRAASERLSDYAGLIERARANNRLGYPVGAAYLRVGSDLMHEEIIPAVEKFGALGDSSLDREYDRAAIVNVSTLLLLLVFVGGAVLVLVVVQRFVTKRTHRTLSPALAAATAAAVLAGLWLTIGLGRQVSLLAGARTNSYELIAAASRARVTAFDARADENLALIARGNGARFNDEFAAAVGAMGDSHQSGLLRDVVEAADEGAEFNRARRAASQWVAYLQAHAAVVKLVADGDQTGAVASSLGPSQEAFAKFDATVDGLIRENQTSFTRRVDSAADAVAPLVPVALIAAVVVSLLTLAGVAPRIAEYR